MGLMELIKFALIWIDFLAWPVIALGYPLFASIRAVESGSKYHMRKSVIYWILFALISLFEFAFLKIIQRIPLWSRIKLVAIFWIVMPWFDVACHAYQSLVRPILFGDVQAVMDKLHKLKEEKPWKSETFADVAEGCIKENVCEASEKVTASKHECTNSQRDIQVIELESKNAEELSKQAKVAAWVTKVTEAATTEVKEMTPQESNAKNRHPDAPPLNKPERQMEWSCLENPPIKKDQQEWACDLCNVRTSSEKTLHDHIQGSKHKFRCESLKANKLDANDTGPSPLATGKLNKSNVEFGAISKEMISTEAREENSHSETAPTKKVQHEWNCNLCKVKTTSEKTLNDHLQGSRHKIRCVSLKITLKIIERIAKDIIRKLNQGNADFGPCAIETTPTEARAKNIRQETPPFKKVQQEWTCDLCKVKTTSEKTLNDHLRGNKHKSKCESLKASKVNAKDTGSLHSAKGKLKQDNLDPGTYAKEKTPIEASETPPIKKVQQEWPVIHVR